MPCPKRHHHRDYHNPHIIIVFVAVACAHPKGIALLHISVPVPSAASAANPCATTIYHHHCCCCCSTRKPAVALATGCRHVLLIAPDAIATFHVRQ